MTVVALEVEMAVILCRINCYSLIHNVVCSKKSLDVSKKDTAKRFEGNSQKILRARCSLVLQEGKVRHILEQVAL